MVLNWPSQASIFEYTVLNFLVIVLLNYFLILLACTIDKNSSFAYSKYKLGNKVVHSD